MKVKARFNMELDHGTFVKGKIYKCDKESENGTCWVETEEHMRQGFFLNEIDRFFEIVREDI